MEYITLNNGIKIPQLGLGTYLLKPDDAQSSVTSALGMGYELIDTANAYVNERAVGRGVRESDLPRENVFLETKLWPYFYKRHRRRRNARASERTLHRPHDSAPTRRQLLGGL